MTIEALLSVDKLRSLILIIVTIKSIMLFNDRFHLLSEADLIDILM